MFDLLKALAPDCEEFLESVSLGGQEYWRAGFALEDAGQGTVYGSATDPDRERATLRAAAECLERLAIVHAMRSPLDAFSALNGDCSLLSSQLFPSERHEQWSYARSNGVALGLSLDAACVHAEGELYEREVALRSWLGWQQPREQSRRVEGVRGDQIHRDIYQLATLDEWSVSVCLLSSDRVPGRVIHGFGAAKNSEHEAAEKSAREALQRLLFLFDEAMPSEEPAFSPDAGYHQDYYLTEQGAQLLRNWVAGARYRAGADSSLPRTAIPLYFDITPREWRGRCAVVKAWRAEFQPLCFGRPPALGKLLSAERLSEIHPIC